MLVVLVVGHPAPLSAGQHSPAPTSVVRLTPPVPAADKLPAVLMPLRPYIALLTREAQAQRLPASLVLAVALVESDGDASAVSPAGAVGLLQVMPREWPELCPCSAPAANVRAGVHILRVYADLAGASTACLSQGPGGSPDCAWRTDEALSSYNAGPRGRYAAEYVRRVRAQWVQTKGALVA